MSHLQHNILNSPHHHQFMKHFEQQHQLNQLHQQHQLQQQQQHQQQQQQHQQSQQHNQNMNNNSSSNASTPNSNTSFLIKDILRYEGQKRKQRKARTAFSDHQLRELESMFEAKKYLSVQDRIELASKLKLSDTQVKTWYQNRRTKHKRQTAVGFELLNEASHLMAYQQVLQSPFSTNWMFANGGTGAPGASANSQYLAAAAALLAVQSGSLNAQQQQQQHQLTNNLMQQQANHLHQQQAASLDNSAAREPSISPSSSSPNSPEVHKVKQEHWYVHWYLPPPIINYLFKYSSPRNWMNECLVIVILLLALFPCTRNKTKLYLRDFLLIF